MARYFCRICDSNLNWVHPSLTNPATDGLDTHFGSFGFAYEEWNFDFTSLIINNLKFGWIEGFDSSKPGRKSVPDNTPHDIALYVFTRGVGPANRYRYVGKIIGCKKLPRPAKAEISGLVGRIPFYTAPMAAQANTARSLPSSPIIFNHSNNTWDVAPILTTGMSGYIKVQFPNIEFDKNNYFAHTGPHHFLPCGGSTGIKATRYGALEVKAGTYLDKIWNALP
jgi:hypothetical protein